MTSTIIPPTVCPACASELVLKNALLYCINSNCPGQGAKLVENFAKVLKIKGLGPASINKLGLTSIEDIYACPLDFIVDELGAALGNKLYEQIQISKSASLNDLLPALGIPLIGKTAAAKICDNFEDLYELSLPKLKEILGPKAYENFAEWYLRREWEELPFSFKSERKKEISESTLTVCITGKLQNFKTKAEATKYLEDKGYTVVASVTKTTNILVNEGGVESEKTKKARANGTKIVNNILEL